jgi:hypothetical protein
MMAMALRWRIVDRSGPRTRKSWKPSLTEIALVLVEELGALSPLPDIGKGPEV